MPSSSTCCDSSTMFARPTVSPIFAAAERPSAPYATADSFPGTTTSTSSCPVPTTTVSCSWPPRLTGMTTNSSRLTIKPTTPCSLPNCAIGTPRSSKRLTRPAWWGSTSTSSPSTERPTTWRRPRPWKRASARRKTSWKPSAPTTRLPNTCICSPCPGSGGAL